MYTENRVDGKTCETSVKTFGKIKRVSEYYIIVMPSPFARRTSVHYRRELFRDIRKTKAMIKTTSPPRRRQDNERVR